jgi:hypothetical protein
MDGIPSTRRKVLKNAICASRQQQRNGEKTNAQYATLVTLSSETWKKSAVMHKAWYRTSHLHLAEPVRTIRGKNRMYVQSEAVCECKLCPLSLSFFLTSATPYQKPRP